MSIHKLTAGSGYDYLTRQVAALDATDKGHLGLASYYIERGETPGVWLGSGMAGIEGLDVGDAVTAEQMQALFGSGHHPLAGQRVEQLYADQEHAGRLARREPTPEPGPPSPVVLSDREVQSVTRLGNPYKVYIGQDISWFRLEVARRVAGFNRAAGQPVPAPERARIRSAVARELFVAEHGREPHDAHELAGLIARHSRPKTTAVAGYDLTFSPVKSVSTLWAIADPAIAAKIEIAHRQAVEDAVRFMETHALFTRTGTNGVRQVDVRGMVATAFTHRDSRAGDPDLHTHVAVANKVQSTEDGRWLAIDGRVLFKATVVASETYNTALEHHLHDALGVRFADRPNPDPRKRPVREIDGVDAGLNQAWSTRRADIDVRRCELAAAFQASHGRPPTPVESLHLAQQATLETREAKHEPRTLAEQRDTWHKQALEVLGSDQQLTGMVRAALSPAAGATVVPDATWVDQAASRVLQAMERRRSTWQVWHVRAEAHRQVRANEVPTGRVEAVVDLLVADVLEKRSVSLARPAGAITEPAQLRRADGASVYTVAGATQYTSARVLAAEQRLVTTVGRTDGHATSHAAVDMALLECTANGVDLNAGQADLVRQMATSGRRVQLAIAPAGSGKTTAMRALAAAWAEDDGEVVGLAPSAAAAGQLRNQIGTHTDTLAKLTWSLANDPEDLPGWAERIGPSTLVVIDEAGMADTLSLDAVVRFIVARGGSVRLIGDDQQLAAIGAGGVLRDIASTHGAVRMGEPLRFSDPAEAAATLALREGRTEALGFYLDQNRVHVGDLATLTEEVFQAWLADRTDGLDSIMLAPTRDLTADLNQRARTHRLQNRGERRALEKTVGLADGNRGSVGDLVITRSNDRRLRTTPTDWVKNGDRWHVLAVGEQGDLTVQHTTNRRTITLPADYVTASVELGYATTVHTAQGVSTDTMHGLATGDEPRQQLYTMLTRGRVANHLYLQVVGDGDPHSVIRPELTHPATPTDLLEQVLARDGSPTSASTLLRDRADPATRLTEATSHYLDALYVAAETTLGAEAASRVEQTAEQVFPGLTQAPAWPALRAHLMLLAAHGDDPVEQLHAAADEREVTTAGDVAAVLDWRLDDTGMRTTAPGPFPWVPGIPDVVAADPTWGDYLTQRARLVTDLADQVRTNVLEVRAGHLTRTPTWAPAGSRVPNQLLADVTVWRAAMGVAVDDRRPTGAPQLQKAAARWQRRLNKQVAGGRAPAMQEWSPLLTDLAPGLAGDDFTSRLADRLSAIARAGLDAPRLLQYAATDGGALPNEHAAALWWRINRHLSPAVAAQIDDDQTLTPPWTSQLPHLVGRQRAERLQTSQCGSPWSPPSTTDYNAAGNSPTSSTHPPSIPRTTALTSARR